MSSPNNLVCAHCGLSFPPAEQVRANFAEQQYLFCCQGCRGAWLIINDAGLEHFYARKDLAHASLKDAPAAEFDPGYLQKFIIAGAEGAEISLIIDGIRCASCIWLIEKFLQKIPGVLAARVNFATHRLLLKFNPQQVEISKLCRQLTLLGYKPRPYSQDEVRRAMAQERHSLLLRFGTAVFLAMQLMGFSIALYAGYFKGISPQTRLLLQVLAALVTTPIVFYSGFPFLRGAWFSLRNLTPNMDLLIALGSLTAYCYSLFALFSGREVYFDTAGMIVTLILAGRLFESSARQRASAGLDRLLQLIPANTTRLTAEGREQVDSRMLELDDLIQISPGDRFPVDGVIVAGSSEVDEATVNGEPLPSFRQTGDSVLAGTQNLNGNLTLRVTAKATDSFIARIGQLIEQTQTRKAPIQNLADRISAIFIPLVLLIALLTFCYWGADQQALLHAITVLVVACPCALGLATPAAVMVAAGRAAEAGVLFRGGDTIETASRIDLLAFDKTGTLTKGEPRVTAIHALTSEDELLAIAAGLETGSRHPLALGIVQEAKKRQICYQPLSEIQQIPGKGLTTRVGNLFAGTADFLREQGISIPEQRHDASASVIHFAREGVYQGAITLQDVVRSEAQEALALLHRRGYASLLLSGDQPGSARKIAEMLNLDRWQASLTPEDKTREIERLMKAGRQVLMTGDGLNDAPALAAASLSCSLVGSSDIAMEQAQILLTRPNLLLIPWALKTARNTLTIIRQNLFWAFSYNLIAIPLAASGQLLPAYGAAAMALSSVGVLLNSLRLKKIPPP
jgi:Cu2+-exporting ATPase